MAGDKIKELRKMAGLTQDELAKLSGLSRSSICKYEKGIMKPKLEQLRKIAIALNVPLSTLSSYDMRSIEVSDSKTETLVFDIPKILERMEKSGAIPAPDTYRDINQNTELLREMLYSNFRNTLNIPDDIIIHIPDYIKSDFAFIQNDDSMKDIGITSGDIVFVQMLEEYYSGDTVLLSIDNIVKVRKVFFEDDFEIYIPENASFDIEIVKEEQSEKYEIWGKVVAVLKQFP